MLTQPIERSASAGGLLTAPGRRVQQAIEIIQKTDDSFAAPEFVAGGPLTSASFYWIVNHDQEDDTLERSGLMKLAMPVLLAVYALWPVGSANADTLKLNSHRFTLGETAEKNGDIIFAAFNDPPPGFKPGAGVVLTDGKFNSDVLFYVATPLGGAFEFASATSSSLKGSFAGFTFLPETGKFQDVGAIFGLGNGQLQVQSADAHHAATPLPPTWTIMLTGLVGLGFMLYRRKRPDDVEGMAGLAVA